MRKLDFLSNSPKTFIFEKSSNKTTFGGSLTLIYIFIVFLIAITYAYNYYANDKYIISYIKDQKSILIKQQEEFKNDPKYNPTLNFSIDLLDQITNESLSENFIILGPNGKILERNKFYSYKVSDFGFYIYYKCLNLNCDLQPEDKNKYENQVYYKIALKEQMFILNLQNNNQPIDLIDGYYLRMLIMNQNIPQYISANWEVIKVTEEKGLFDNFIGNKKELIGGKISSSFNYFNFKSTIIKIKIDDEISYYKPIFGFAILTDYNSIVEYRRKKISIFDILANICSLSLTIFHGFQFGFSFFYSQNFDNYKIIDKILTSKGKSREKKINDAKFDKSFPLLNENEMNEEEEKDVDKINLITDSVSEKNEDSLPKYHFFNFIFNLFSCKCCQRGKVQKSITICNNIMEKYYSIENLIYSQFMLENLLQDYKWNNPDLNSIKNIELIYKLKQVIKTEGVLQ